MNENPLQGSFAVDELTDQLGGFGYVRDYPVGTVNP